MPDDIPFAGFITIRSTSMYKYVVDDLAALRGSVAANVMIDYSLSPNCRLRSCRMPRIETRLPRQTMLWPSLVEAQRGWQNITTHVMVYFMLRAF